MYKGSSQSSPGRASAWWPRVVWAGGGRRREASRGWCWCRGQHRTWRTSPSPQRGPPQTLCTSPSLNYSGVRLCISSQMFKLSWWQSPERSRCICQQWEGGCRGWRGGGGGRARPAGRRQTGAASARWGRCRGGRGAGGGGGQWTWPRSTNLNTQRCRY